MLAGGPIETLWF